MLVVVGLLVVVGALVVVGLLIVVDLLEVVVATGVRAVPLRFLEPTSSISGLINSQN